MPFIHDDFLLKSETARKLYHAYAASEPIVDYHSHLPPADIARNRRFRDLSEIWLEGDHYKWRACVPAALPSDIARAMPRPKKNSWPGRALFRLRCAILFATGLI
jgi:glucuronate isomerase